MRRAPVDAEQRELVRTRRARLAAALDRIARDPAARLALPLRVAAHALTSATPRFRTVYIGVHADAAADATWPAHPDDGGVACEAVARALAAACVAFNAAVDAEPARAFSVPDGVVPDDRHYFETQYALECEDARGRTFELAIGVLSGLPRPSGVTWPWITRLRVAKTPPDFSAVAAPVTAPPAPAGVAIGVVGVRAKSAREFSVTAQLARFADWTWHDNADEAGFDIIAC